MKLPKNCKIEAVASCDATHRRITEPYLEIANGEATLIATDGRAMAILPVEPGPHDVSGYVSTTALVEARKLVRKGELATLDCNGACTTANGVSFPRPFAVPCDAPDDYVTTKYPNWRKVVPDMRTRKVGFRVTLDPALLMRLAQAMGVESGSGVTLEFGEDDSEPAIVTGGTGGGRGILMLMRAQ